jgi:WD40 repeat protein
MGDSCKRVSRRALVIFISLLAGLAAQPALAGTATPLSLTSFGNMVVDDTHQQVFVSGGGFGSSIVVLDFDGQLVTTITGQQGATGMALDPSTGTLYVALQTANSISRINTDTLTEISRFTTTGMSGPRRVALAGGRVWFDYNCGGPGGIGSAALDGTGVEVEGGVDCVTFATSPGDPDLLAAAVIQGSSVRVYDVSTGALVETASESSPGGTAGIRDIALTPDAAEMMIASNEPNSINSFLLSDFTLARSFPTGPYPVAVASTADGQFVAAGAEAAAAPDIFIFQADETPVRSWDVGGASNLLSDRGLAFSANSQRLFAVTHTPTGNLTFRTTANPTAAPAPTTITLTASASTVVYGRSLTLSAHLSGATGSVSFYGTPLGGSKALVGTVAVNAFGNASLVVQPGGKTTYTAEFAGDDAAAASASPGKTVTVQARTTVALRRFYGSSGKYKLYHYPRDPYVLGTVAPNHYGMSLKFVAQRYSNGAWRTGTTRTIAITLNGTAYAYLRNTVKGSYRVRVIFPGDADHLASKSPWAYLRITS